MILIAHLLGPQGIMTWERDGILIINNVVPHLCNIQNLINQEFDLYQHHSRSERHKKGWLQDMYFSLV